MSKLKCKYQRIGNIAVEYSALNKSDEIVCYYANPYYKAENKLKKQGWTFDKEGNAHKDNCHVSHGCFVGKECCYTVAFIVWNKCHDEYDIRIVGDRYWRLDTESRLAFDNCVMNLIESDEEDYES